ncbi:MAG: response regulator, partial [Candidatus Omnitrophota bacterium]
MARIKAKSEKTKILVTDDDKEIVKILYKLLTHAGYEVLTASSGEEALGKVKDDHPDLILLDIMMPGIDGMEVKAKLNEDTATASIPVIFL